MDWYEPELLALERTRRSGAWPSSPVVFYGSSSIRAWDSIAADLNDARVVNLGFGGSTLEACAHYLERLVFPLVPASLIVYAGENDLGDGRGPAQVVEAFRTLLAKLHQGLGPVPFGFISIKPSPSRASLLPAMREVNDIVRRDLARHPSAFFVDVFEPMLNGRGEPRPELFLEDGVHLSRAGYILWRDVLLTFRHRIFAGS